MISSACGQQPPPRLGGCHNKMDRTGSRTLDPDPAGAPGVKNSRPRPRGDARGQEL